MRSNDVQFSEIMKRSGRIKERRALNRKIVTDAVVAVIFLVLMVVTAISIPKLSEYGTEVTEQHYGSLSLVVPYLGYVMVGILAFALGITATILCLHIRQMRQKDESRA